MYNMIIQGTKSQKLINYVERVYNYLGLDEYEDVLIDFDFRPKLVGNAGGYCDGDDEMINVEIARSDAVGKISMKDLMINIAHELVHAQQIASGRLINKGFVFRKDNPGALTTKQIFDGQEYIGTPYAEQPWEIEAYGLENKIYEECK